MTHPRQQVQAGQHHPPEYIQLEAGDDVIAIRDRLSFIRGRRVLLIWPENGTALQRKLDLVLIQREARRRVLQLALVTHDSTVIQHAQELGISVFNTIESSEDQRWKRGRHRVFTQRYHKPQEDPEPQELMPVASRVRARRRQWAWWQSIFGRLFVLLTLLATIGGALYLTVPGATVYLSLQQQQITAESTITAGVNIPDVNIEERRIPATVLRATVQTSSTINTTGVENIEDLAAIGFATFTNQTQRSVTIPANTRISTSAGTPITFTTNVDLVLPAGVGQRADVAIRAVQAGDSGNVAAGMINTIEGELATDVTVRNLAATTGGESRNYAIVTAQDRDRILAIARGQLQALAYEEIRLNLTDTQRIVIETIRIAEERNDWTTYSHEVGAISDALILNMRAVVEAVAIDDRFARQILLAELSTVKPRDFAILPDSFDYVRGALVDVITSEDITFTASGSAIVTPQIDAVELAQAIAGMSLQEAHATLQNRVPLITDADVQITLQPDWLTHLPYLPVRIQIQSDS